MSGVRDGAGKYERYNGPRDQYDEVVIDEHERYNQNEQCEFDFIGELLALLQSVTFEVLPITTKRLATNYRKNTQHKKERKKKIRGNKT